MQMDSRSFTRATPATLQGIAQLTDGVFIDGTSADRPGRVRAALRRLRQTERVYNAGTSPIQRYSLFLWPAFVLLLLDALLAERVRRSRAMRVAALLGGVTLLAPTQAAAQRSGQPDAMTLFGQRKFTAAAQLLRSQMEQGDRTLRTQYNLGTALLEADSIVTATDALERVVTVAPDADLRFRALFNLGLANLRRARAASPGDAGKYYAAAVAAYKRALRTRADDPDAKWNLELAIREQQRQGGGGGDGGGGKQPPPTPPPPASPDQKELDKQRAASVLNSAARDERDVQARRQRDGRRREAPAGRDW